MTNRWKGNIIAAAATTSSGTDYTGKANGAWGLNSQLQQKQGGLWAKGQTVPAAPTSVTAATGNAQATVSFTAPSDNGGSAITSYTVTSSTGGITATGSASPITITGLTNGTAYTFTVTATNAVGTGASSSPSNSVIPVSVPTVIGQAFGGGFYAGKISETGNGVATHYLIISPKASGQIYSSWGPSGVTGATSEISGNSNTAILAALGSSYTAAYFCENLSIATYTDWYLPSKNELEVLYYNLKPTTDNNNTSSGSNGNAVPPEPISTNYTTSSPARTSASLFVAGASEAFGNDNHYSSTEFSSSNVWTQEIEYDGAQTKPTKGQYYYSRAIRRIPV